MGSDQRIARRRDLVKKLKQRVRHDLKYIEKWSVWLDLKIIPWTLHARTQRSHRGFEGAARSIPLSAPTP